MKFKTEMVFWLPNFSSEINLRIFYIKEFVFNKGLLLKNPLALKKD